MRLRLSLPLLLLTVLFLIPGFSVSGLEWTVEVRPNPVGVNDSFTLEVRIPGALPQEVEVPKPELPQGVQVWRGPSVRTVQIPAEAGEPQTGTAVSWSFRSQQAGRILFPGLKIMTAAGEIVTEPFLLEVGIYRNRVLQIPLETGWVAPYDFVYTGEAVPLILEVFRQREVGLFDRVSVSPPSTGIWEPSPGLGKILSFQAAGTVLYRIPAASFLYTPTQGARIAIPAATVSQGEVTGRAERLDLEILPLPPEVEATGAVGDFRITGIPSTEAPVRGGRMLYTLRVEGTGNLNYLRIPQGEFRGATVLSRHEEQEYVPTLEGYRGYRQVVYTLQLGETDSLQVRIPPFPFVERPSGEIRPSRGRTVSYTLAAAQTVNRQEEAAEEQTPVFLLPGTDLLSSFDFLVRPRLLFWLLPGPLAFLLAVLIRRGGGRKTLVLLFFLVPLFWMGSSAFRPESREQDYGVCLEFYERGDFREALEALEIRDPEFGGRGFHEYNKAVASSGLGDLPRAILLVSRAVAAEPMNPLFRETLLGFEEKAGVQSPYPPRWPLDPRLFFLILLVLVNALGVLGILVLVRPGSFVAILMILSSGLLAADLGLGAASLISGAVPLGIISASEPAATSGKTPASRTQAFLKRIPRPEGEDWLPLICGTPVRIRDRAGNFYLVENGEKISGWISETCVIPVDRR